MCTSIKCSWAWPALRVLALPFVHAFVFVYGFLKTTSEK